VKAINSSIPSGVLIIRKITTQQQRIYLVLLSMSLVLVNTGVAEFGAGGTRNDSFTVPASGNGNTVQVGLEADVNGNYLALQKIDIFAKQGKVL
jgi:hypothetical protein